LSRVCYEQDLNFFIVSLVKTGLAQQQNPVDWSWFLFALFSLFVGW